MFVTCSTNFAWKFVLQAMNVWRPGNEASVRTKGTFMSIPYHQPWLQLLGLLGRRTQCASTEPTGSLSSAQPTSPLRGNADCIACLSAPLPQGLK